MKQPLKNRMWAASCIICLVLGLSWVYLLLFAGEVRERVTNPDGSLIAESRLDGSFAFATDASIASVELRTKLNPFRHKILVGLDYGAEVKISWSGPRNLVVKCSSCKNLDVRRKEDSWRDVSITYELD